MPEDAAATGLPFSLDSLLQLVRRNGWSVILAALFVIGAIAYLPKVSGQLDTIQTTEVTIMQQHSDIASKFQSFENLSVEGNRIACAACWNGSKDQEDIKRCSCNPK